MGWDPSDESQFQFPAQLLESAAAHVARSPQRKQRRYTNTKLRKGNSDKRNTAKKTRCNKTPSVESQAEGERAEDLGGSAVFGNIGDPYGSADVTVDDHEPNVDDGENDDCLIPVPVSDSEPATDKELDYFIDSVANGVAGFKHVHTNICVVQGWDSVRLQTLVSNRTHSVLLMLKVH